MLRSTLIRLLNRSQMAYRSASNSATSSPAHTVAAAARAVKPQKMPITEDGCRPCTANGAKRPVTMRFALHEFFMHPLTWVRNNGFINILLALCTLSSFATYKTKTPQTDESSSEETPDATASTKVKK